MRSNRKSKMNQDPTHREQQKLFIFLGQLISLKSQLIHSVSDRNNKLTEKLDLIKYVAVSSQTSIELNNLINQVRAQMRSLKDIVGEKK